MTRAPTSMYTTEFRHEFEADTAVLLARRFTRFILAWGGLSFVYFLVRWGGSILERRILEGDYTVIGTPRSWESKTWVTMLIADASVLFLYAVAWSIVRNVQIPRARILQLSAWMVLVEGVIRLVASLVASEVSPLPPVTLTHLAAAIFLPWTPWQALRPMLGVLSLNLILTLVLRNHLLSEERVWVPLLLSPLLLAPGTMVAWLKHSRRIEQYKLKILARRYGEFRRELLDARKIHEAMFPKPITDGAVRFWYEYEPMRAIGGDFVFASMPPEHKGRRMSVVLMDVTGHGIAAALTVNRLSGELERVFGENPDVSPGEVLRLLNRYIHLTLARHSVYATALCLKIDCDANTVEYSSGGHPPAFLRGIDGTLHELESTTFVLGVCHHDDFDPAQQSLRYGPGDVIIAYTDGAMEARNEQGRMLGVKGMRSCLASTQSNVALLARHSLSRRPMEDTCGVWARALLQAVDAYRSGPPDDDTLVVEISRPIGGGIHAAAPPASGTTVGA